MLLPRTLLDLNKHFRNESPGGRRRRGAAFKTGAHDWRLEERCLMAVDFPGPFVQHLSDVFYDGVDPKFAKTITITNNSDKTIYPFLEGENSRYAVGPYIGTAAFDPYDPANQEFRGYIGYSDGSGDHAGLAPKSVITVTVPLVFWDSGRLMISTDGEDQFSTYKGDESGNPPGTPFNFFKTDSFARYIAEIKNNGGQMQLVFTPIYTSFSGGKPSTGQWKTPIDTGELPVNTPNTQNKQTYRVTGPGLPDAGVYVTLDPTQKAYVSLPTSGVTPKGVDQYVFQAVTSDAAHKDMSIFTTARYVQTDVPLTVTSGGTSTATTKGAVMWYHDLNANAPNNVAPFQLTEFSFRGPFYDAKANPGTGFSWLLDNTGNPGPKSIYAGSIVNLADYDISFVDTIDLPVAMEATNVTIPAVDNAKADFGWVGSSQTVKDFQDALQAFAATNKNGINTNGLGMYFDGKGYPSYNVLQDGNTKLPSAQNVFFSSPLVKGVSSIQYYKKFSDGSIIRAPLFALTSGGTGPSQIGIGGSTEFLTTGDKTIGLATNHNLANQYALANIIANDIKPGPGRLEWDVYDNNQKLNLGPVDSIIYKVVDKVNIPIGVTLKNKLPGGVKPLDSFVFTPLLSDYASTRIAGLWYSWAKFYVEKMASIAKQALDQAGTISNGNILTLTGSTSDLKLVPGMKVTGSGVQQGCIILSVSPDQKTIELSGVVNANGGKYSFFKPDMSSIAGSTQLPTFKLDFAKDTKQDQAAALPFAQTVFTVMAAWSVSVPAGNPPLVWDPLMINIIGGNLSNKYIPAVNDDVKTALTILSKSALRGVPNYTSPLYSDPSQWYPDPSLEKGSLKYNAFNLDPFVWFIHNKLGLTAYAFALDDDIGNVEAGGTTNFDVNVGGLGGLPDPTNTARKTMPNKDPYSNTAQFGVVTTTATAANIGTDPQPKSSQLGSFANTNVVGQVLVYNNPHHTVGTLVNGPGVVPGTTVQFTKVSTTDPKTNAIVITAPVSTAAKNTPYSFFGQLVFTAYALGNNQKPNTIILTDKDAAATLAKLGPLGNIRVTGEGIDPSKPPVMISGMKTDNGVTTITLNADLIKGLVPSPGAYYAYTFGGPTLDVVRDGGFEYYIVGKVTDNYLHGGQISPQDSAKDRDDWTFFDSPTKPKDWFGGIALVNSKYVGPQQVVPQGVQVGFLQGDSYITQPVILAQGTYAISLMAAQSAKNQNGLLQSLNVIVDNKVYKTIKPTNTTFTAFNDIRFSVGPGTHTVKLQGVDKNASTVLFDSVVCKAVALGLTQSPVPAPHVILNAGGNATVGIPFRGTGAFSSSTSGPFTATVDYGDGTGLHNLSLTAQRTFALDHTYDKAGTFTITVRVSDRSGRIGTGTLKVDVKAAPTLQSGFGARRDAFVTSLYRENFGAPPDLDGLKAWSRRLAAGVDPVDVVLAIWGSDQHRTLVKQGLIAPITFRQTFVDAVQAARQVLGPGQRP